MGRMILVVIVCLFALYSLSKAQTVGEIRLFADIEGTECNIVDNSPGFVEVHMIVTGVAGFGGIQFSAPKPDCWIGATWVGDNIPFPTVIGDSQNNYEGGLSVAFGYLCNDGGATSPFYIGKISYLTQGEAQPCCVYSVRKADVDGHPEINSPLIVYCDITLGGIHSGYAIINADDTCACYRPVPTQDTTWGRVKVLYGR
jgi:hypothetical protein